MVEAGTLDAIMIAEKEIEQKYNNLLRVPVMLAKGSLILYCSEKVYCHPSALNKIDNVIGVVRGSSMSANFMQHLLIPLKVKNI
mgnify:CR=1 FL=1